MVKRTALSTTQARPHHEPSSCSCPPLPGLPLPFAPLPRCRAETGNVGLGPRPRRRRLLHLLESPRRTIRHPLPLAGLRRPDGDSPGPRSARPAAAGRVRFEQPRPRDHEAVALPALHPGRPGRPLPRDLRLRRCRVHHHGRSLPPRRSSLRQGMAGGHRRGKDKSPGGTRLRQGRRLPPASTPHAGTGRRVQGRRPHASPDPVDAARWIATHRHGWRRPAPMGPRELRPRDDPRTAVPHLHPDRFGDPGPTGIQGPVLDPPKTRQGGDRRSRPLETDLRRRHDRRLRDPVPGRIDRPSPAARPKPPARRPCRPDRNPPARRKTVHLNPLRRQRVSNRPRRIRPCRKRSGAAFRADKRGKRARRSETDLEGPSDAGATEAAEGLPGIRLSHRRRLRGLLLRRSGARRWTDSPHERFAPRGRRTDRRRRAPRVGRLDRGLRLRFPACGRVLGWPRRPLEIRGRRRAPPLAGIRTACRGA